jgi:hypothetical protein
MDSLSSEQLEQLARDIAFVKKAIEKNSSILNRIDFRGSLRLTVLLSALSIFLFCGIFQLLDAHFGGFWAVPAYLKAIVFCAIALDITVLGILKNMGVLKSARSLDPGMSLFHLIREYYSARMYHHFIPTGLVLLFACIFAWETGHARLLIPFISIGVGLLYNTFNTFLRIDEFLIFGYWFIVTGCILVVFNSVSPLLGLSLTLGCGLLLLSFLWYLPQRKGNRA